MTKIFAIRNKETGEFQVYNGRCAWTKYGNAVNAFNANRPCMDQKTFEDTYYKLYAIIELVESYNHYKTMSQQDIRRELSGTEFWNEDKGDRA